MFRFIVLCACVGLSLQAAVEQKETQAVSKKNDWDDWEKPEFCRENDCPVYEVLEKGEGYEKRKYSAGQWVSTSIESIEWGNNTSDMFWKLFLYISGENEAGQEIAMTSPVLTKVIPGSGPNCKSTFVRSFYIEYSSQNTAPLPTRSDVYLETLPEMTVYVRNFGGYATTDDHLSNIIDLGAAIGDESKFFTGLWYAVGYDSPYRPFGRHNEGWLIALS